MTAHFKMHSCVANSQFTRKTFFKKLKVKNNPAQKKTKAPYNRLAKQALLVTSLS